MFVDMQTRSLATLVEISKVGSFRTAAGNLNMTLSALSMQMKALEQDLGVVLFDRAFRPPKLTPIGRTVCRRAMTVLAAEEELRASSTPGDRLTGSYRLGFVATASVRLLPDFLITAQERAPQAEFEVTSGLSEALEEQVLAGQLDAAVVSASPITKSSLRYDVLRTEALVYAVPKALDGLSLQDLSSRLAFLHFTPSSGIGKLTTGYLAETDSQPQRTIVLDNVEAIMECVKKGLGYTLLPHPDIARYTDSSVAEHAPVGAECTRQLVLASLARPHRNSQIARIRKLVMDGHLT